MNINPITAPKVGKGTRFPFQVSIASWSDLLGYGAKMAESGFNPLDEGSRENIQRLRAFHKAVAESSHRYFPTLVLNDGAASYRDLSLRTRSVGHDFLQRAWQLFKKVNSEERKKNLPGMRMVVACGFRVRGRKAVVQEDNAQLKSILKRYHEGLLSFDQAVREAFVARPSFDIVPQLQANFAFTKAYVAETSGKSGGLEGPNFFLDLSLLRGPQSQWPVLDDVFCWRHKTLGLDTCFGKVREISNFTHSTDGATQMRNGLEVAQALAGEEDVLEALRRAKSTLPYRYGNR